MTDTILETRGLTRHDGGVHRLSGAHVTLRRGEHVAITGEPTAHRRQDRIGIQGRGGPTAPPLCY